jgi:hypothetical protein
VGREIRADEVRCAWAIGRIITVVGEAAHVALCVGQFPVLRCIAVCSQVRATAMNSWIRERG